ncbi:MAG: twin-arginine translocase subunit TatB [Bradyrhizobium sp.]|uniref:Sec-independent protein translocase protein TatB n=1 Tax=Bradyrhizobium sp. TaxID=376 RepID=UPI00239EED80|nr:Sec-independent protein translocase protein TatB [Bradyrhizobium sp.]MDE2601988.1 twin-arginine translocase subunit TatB [Bradyrhizobium sp.]
MFNIGWSEIAVIAVVALIAIGPKELPGVLRMVGRWMGKARRMAAEFQGQFNEAMREAEMADLKKSFDEVREAASGLARGNVMNSLQKDVTNALRVDDGDKPMDAQAASGFGAPLPSSDTPAGNTTAANSDPVVPTTPAAPLPETFAEAETHVAAEGPLAIPREIQPEPAPPAISIPRDAKAS